MFLKGSRLVSFSFVFKPIFLAVGKGVQITIEKAISDSNFTLLLSLCTRSRISSLSARESRHFEHFLPFFLNVCWQSSKVGLVMKKEFKSPQKLETQQNERYFGTAARGWLLTFASLCFFYRNLQGLVSVHSVRERQTSTDSKQAPRYPVETKNGRATT